MIKKEEIQNYKNRLSEILQNDNLIEGIHNYCDRWCEKCTKTKHCAVFIMEQEDNNTEINDINNEKFWDKLSLIFAATFDMIAEDVKKLGIDLNEIKVKPINHKINKTKIEKTATKYGIEITNWLDDNADLFKQKAQQLNIINDKRLISLTDAIEIIQWYSLFISAKIHRANFSAIIDEEDRFEREDKNLSAKIALIAIDRSIEALNLLYKEIKEKEDEILDFLVTLSKIKNQTETKFPDARNFKRPGFDN